MINIGIYRLDIYRLDIYRLLTLLLADKAIVKDKAFQDLGNDNFDNEVNRLLVLIAVVTRQLLRGYSSSGNELCGKFYYNYPTEKTPQNLTFKKACSMIIHATDITIKSLDYYYSETISQEPNQAKYWYYQGIVTITGEKKKRAELDFDKFAKYCIKLSKM